MNGYIENDLEKEIERDRADLNDLRKRVKKIVARGKGRVLQRKRRDDMENLQKAIAKSTAAQ